MTKYKLVDGVKVEMSPSEIQEVENRTKLIEKTEADDDFQMLRIERNRLLAETDWMANSDVTMSTAWKNYRQALRDITKTYKSMDDKDFKFPDKPK